MIILLTLPVIVFFYILWRQLRSYYILQKCGLNPQFDIFGWKGLGWLDSSESHRNFSRMCTIVGDKTFSMMRGSKSVVVTNDADLIHSICTENYDSFHSRIPEVFDPDPVKSEGIHVFAARGERWKRLRTLTSYSLSTGKLKLLFPTIDKCVFEFLDHVNSISESNKVVIDHSHSIFQSHTSFVLVQCAYGSREKNHRDNKFLSVFSNAFGVLSEFQLSLTGKLAYIFPEIDVVFKNSFVGKLLLQDINKQQFLDHLLSLISKFGSSYLRRMNDNHQPTKSETNQYSLLEYFYEHNNDIIEGLDVNKNELAFGRIDMSKVKVEKTISTQEINAQCRFLSVAGFDTTANTLTFLFYFLAQNPEIQSKLYDLEIKTQEEPITFETICDLSFLQNCIFETLRLFPHASPLQHRVCTEKCRIGKYEFREGFQVIINPWGLHHDPTIWGKDANCFRPSRFDELSESQKRAFMPFGVGPRQCVGMRFALLELKTTAFRLLQKYKVQPNGPVYDKHGKFVQMTVRDTGTIWPNEQIGIILEER